MENKIEIRKAGFEEFKICADIVNDWIDACDWLPRIHSRDVIADSFDEKRYSERTILIAVDGDEIAGYMSLGHEGMIHAFYIRDQYRGSGLGKRVMDEAKRLFPEQLELGVWELNKGAKKFYEREEFVEIPEGRKTDTDEGVDDLLMRWSGPST